MDFSGSLISQSKRAMYVVMIFRILYKTNFDLVPLTNFTILFRFASLFHFIIPLLALSFHFQFNFNFNFVTHLSDSKVLIYSTFVPT